MKSPPTPIRSRPSIPSKLRRLLLVGAISLSPFMLAATAHADDNTDSLDARLEGYGDKDVTLHDVGDATAWFIFSGLTVLVLGVTFKSGNRSHLD